MDNDRKPTPSRAFGWTLPHSISDRELRRSLSSAPHRHLTYSFAPIFSVANRRGWWGLAAHVWRARFLSAVYCWDSRPATAWTVSSICSRRPR
jgi:hypothetical protein